MTDIADLLKFEEGYSPTPYKDSLGYPTVGIGIKIGPQGASLSNYTFRVPLDVAQKWCMSFVDDLVQKIQNAPKYADIKAAFDACPFNSPREAVLISMAYQMGLDGLLGFHNTLSLVAAGDFAGAAAGMLNSRWATQTPSRAKRHSDMMRTNIWAPEY